jgi:hypothetical protein
MNEWYYKSQKSHVKANPKPNEQASCLFPHVRNFQHNKDIRHCADVPIRESWGWPLALLPTLLACLPPSTRIRRVAE